MAFLGCCSNSHMYFQIVNGMDVPLLQNARKMIHCDLYMDRLNGLSNQSLASLDLD